MHAFGSVFAEVAVDPDFGLIRVRRLVGAYGAGRIVNPRLAPQSGYQRYGRWNRDGTF
jgi:xanthine dehydrogenase YagR molybdenum-binding subunit